MAMQELPEPSSAVTEAVYALYTTTTGSRRFWRRSRSPPPALRSRRDHPHVRGSAPAAKRLAQGRGCRGGSRNEPRDRTTLLKAGRPRRQLVHEVRLHDGHSAEAPRPVLTSVAGGRPIEGYYTPEDR